MMMWERGAVAERGRTGQPRRTGSRAWRAGAFNNTHKTRGKKEEEETETDRERMRRKERKKERKKKRNGRKKRNKEEKTGKGSLRSSQGKGPEGEH
jgi:hypothetical protein